MQKPLYELVPLRAAVVQCRVNIVAFQKGIADEENKIDELQEYIKKWEKFNDQEEKDA